MANKDYAIHPDFAKFPVLHFSFNGIWLKIVNQILSIERRVRAKRLLKQAAFHSVNLPSGRKINIYEFKGAPSSHKSPAVMYYHGGAFAITYASFHVMAADIYAKRAGCSVFLVDYGLLPTSPFPDGFNDCYEALVWVESHAEGLSIDKKKIAVMGDSCGGALSACVAQKALDENGPQLCGQALIYPVTDRHCRTETAKKYVDVPIWNSHSNRKMWFHYLKRFKGGKTPLYAAPMDRKNLSNLPRAYIETAQFDPLCEEGALYAKALEQDGVLVEKNETKGTIHGFDFHLSSLVTQKALSRRCAFLKKIFH